MKKRTLRILLPVTVLALAMQATSWGGGYIVLRDGSKKQVDSMKVRPNLDVSITVRGNTQLFSKGNYLRVVADKPAEYDQAASLARQKKYDEAIDLLDKVIRNLFGQYWDVKAAGAKAGILLAQEKPEKAVTLLEETFAKFPQYAEGDALGNYFQALIDTKNYDKLEGILSKTMAKGKREDSARAHVTRGDMLMARDDAVNAAVDYMVVTTFFQKVKDIQAEAGYKAGLALEKTGSAKAKNLFKKAAEADPGSEWGKKAKAKL